MLRKQRIYNRIVVGILALVLIACGGDNSTNDGESSEVTTNRPAVATMPIPDFSSVGKQSEITDTVDSRPEAEVEDSGPDLALGERVYGNHCAECHGSTGEGGDAAALAKLALDFDAFEDILRTGGDLGPEHLFGPQKVSPGGLEALHAYLVE